MCVFPFKFLLSGNLALCGAIFNLRADKRRIKAKEKNVTSIELMCLRLIYLCVMEAINPFPQVLFGIDKCRRLMLRNTTLFRRHC
jgi:hypothetical protein